jgi:hypothetical protein
MKIADLKTVTLTDGAFAHPMVYCPLVGLQIKGAPRAIKCSPAGITIEGGAEIVAIPISELIALVERTK